MNQQQTVIPASQISPVRMLRIEGAERDPYVFGVKDIRRLDRSEDGQPIGVASAATVRAADPLRSLHIYELVNCTV
ncbi:MAG TPA: hypothetical protein VF276_19040 [Chloroflexia bacterium]